MKKIVILLSLIILTSLSMAQRPSSGRGGSMPSRTSVSHSQTPRSSVSHGSTSRSTVSHGTVSNRNSYHTSRNSYSTTNNQSRTNVSVSRSRTTISTTPTQHRNSSNNIVNRPQNSHHNGQFNEIGSTTPMIPNGSHRPHIPNGMHPHPPMHHPIHHHYVHMHHCIVHDWYCGDIYWHSYWNYYHCHPTSDIIIYMNNSNYPRITAIADDSNYIYTIIEECGKTYLTITDDTDHILAKLKIHRKYNKLICGDGGVWLFKNRDKDPIFITYIDNQLYMYEQN